MGRVENWNNHRIRFVQHDGEWWAVAKDVAEALGLKQVTRAINHLPEGGVTTSKVIDDLGRNQVTNIIDEKSIYRLVFKSRKPEAEKFQDWVFEVIKQLRQSTGLEGFAVFRMLDIEHQKQAMKKLTVGLSNTSRVDYIKANTIANKAISNKYGYMKLIKKSEMSPQMLADREPLLDATVELMSTNKKYGVPKSVTEIVYKL